MATGSALDGQLGTKTETTVGTLVTANHFFTFDTCCTGLVGNELADSTGLVRRSGHEQYGPGRQAVVGAAGVGV